MSTTRKDIKNLAEAYCKIYECGCQDAQPQPAIANVPGQALVATNIPTSGTDQADRSEQTREMVMTNLVNINNKAAELVKNMETALQSGEGVEEWVSEKIAVAHSMISTISDYYKKFDNKLPINSINATGLQLQPSTIAANFPVKPMADVIASF
jgi:hypothetical protein